MLKEFKEFALKGNVLDLAVGIIIGAAFTTIVTSLVDDVIMPPIGVILGGIDFSDKYIQLTNCATRPTRRWRRPVRRCRRHRATATSSTR